MYTVPPTWRRGFVRTSSVTSVNVLYSTVTRLLYSGSVPVLHGE